MKRMAISYTDFTGKRRSRDLGFFSKSCHDFAIDEDPDEYSHTFVALVNYVMTNCYSPKAKVKLGDKVVVSYKVEELTFGLLQQTYKFPLAIIV